MTTFPITRPETNSPWAGILLPARMPPNLESTKSMFVPVSATNLEGGKSSLLGGHILYFRIKMEGDNDTLEVVEGFVSTEVYNDLLKKGKDELPSYIGNDAVLVVGSREIQTNGAFHRILVSDIAENNFLTGHYRRSRVRVSARVLMIESRLFVQVEMVNVFEQKLTMNTLGPAEMLVYNLVGANSIFN